MWPWEHVAVGYVALSVSRRALPDSRVSDGAALAVVVGALFPDLVDKPLAWWLGVFPSGRAIAHSLLVAVPLVGGVVLVTRRGPHAQLGTAFGLGYLLHLPGDVLYPVLVGSRPAVRFLVYPLLAPTPGPAPGGFAKLGELIAEFDAFLATPLGTWYLLGESVLMLAALGLWIADGMPGLGAMRRRFAKTSI